MPTKINLELVRGDTRRLVFSVKTPKNKPENIFGWSGFKLTVNSSENPVDDTTQVSQVTGAIETNGLDGRIRFVPDGDIPVGNFFFDIQCLDEEANKLTLAKGSYKGEPRHY